MLKEVCFTVEALENNSIFAIAVGALPTELHAWFTTRVLTVGNSEREVAVSRMELRQLIQSAQTWIVLNGSIESTKTYEVEALEKTLLILREFIELSLLYVITFSNCEGEITND